MKIQLEHRIQLPDWKKKEVYTIPRKFQPIVSLSIILSVPTKLIADLSQTVYDSIPIFMVESGKNSIVLILDIMYIDVIVVTVPMDFFLDYFRSSVSLSLIYRGADFPFFHSPLIFFCPTIDIR